MTGPRRRRTAPMRRENVHPPRYLLMTAAAALPRRKAEQPTATFEADCPGCGRVVLFTEVVTPDGIDYSIEDHDCR